jgi:hypothetical protein
MGGASGGAGGDGGGVVNDVPIFLARPHDVVDPVRTEEVVIVEVE